MGLCLDWMSRETSSVCKYKTKQFYISNNGGAIYMSSAGRFKPSLVISKYAPMRSAYAHDAIYSSTNSYRLTGTCATN